MMNKTVLIVLLYYMLLQSSCSDMVLRTVRVNNKKMQIGFQRVLWKDDAYNSLTSRRIGKDEPKPFITQNQTYYYITAPKNPTDKITISEPVTSANSNRIAKGDFIVDYNLGEITKANLKYAVRTKLKGNLNVRMLKLQVPGDTCATIIWYERNVKSYSRKEVCQIIESLPNNTKLVIDIIFVSPLPPKVVGGVSNLAVLTLTD